LMIAAFAGESGARVVVQRCVRDDPEALRVALLDAAADADVIITSGGVSAGEADHLPGVLRGIGEIHFHKVRLKPGMPTLFGELGACLYFGLPGNPVAAAVTYRVFIAFALRAMSGVTSVPKPARASMRPCTSATRARSSRDACCTSMTKACNGRPCTPSRAPACCVDWRKPTRSRCCRKTRANSPRATSSSFGHEIPGTDPHGQTRVGLRFIRAHPLPAVSKKLLRDNAAMSIHEITPREALQRQQAGALLLDVREAFEHATGMAAGALPLPRGEVAGR